MTYPIGEETFLNFFDVKRVVDIFWSIKNLMRKSKKSSRLLSRNDQCFERHWSCDTLWIYHEKSNYLTKIVCRMKNIFPARSVDIGSVRSHAMRIPRIVPPWSHHFPCSCAMVPATPDDIICVVDTGRWKWDAVWIVIAVIIDATVACA